MAATMLPPPEVLPDVLPSERLTASGRPRPELREDLRRIPDARNAVTVAGAWAQSVGVIAAAVWFAHPVTWVAAFFLMGRAFVLLNIFGHEAAHRLLFSDKRLNDWVGRWLLAFPGWVPLELYRRAHMAHHKDEFGPNEPDMNLYQGYPISQASLRRKLTRDLVGISGWKNVAGLFRGLRRPATRGQALRMLAAQALLLAGFTAVCRPELYVVYWFLPSMTLWRVFNRLRAIAEHGGMTRSADRRVTTHHVRQSRLARFWIVPYNTGWHLAHHVDMGVPFRHLPELHRLLVESGWVTEGLEYTSYLALWRKLASR